MVIGASIPTVAEPPLPADATAVTLTAPYSAASAATVTVKTLTPMKPTFGRSILLVHETKLALLEHDQSASVSDRFVMVSPAGMVRVTLGVSATLVPEVW